MPPAGRDAKLGEMAQERHAAGRTQCQAGREWRRSDMPPTGAAQEGHAAGLACQRLHLPLIGRANATFVAECPAVALPCSPTTIRHELQLPLARRRLAASNYNTRHEPLATSLTTPRYIANDHTR